MAEAFKGYICSATTIVVECCPQSCLRAGIASPDALALTFRTPPWLHGHVSGEVMFLNA